MKKIVVLFLVIQSSFLLAQEPPKMPKYIARNAALVFYYQINEIPEDIKVKKEEIANRVKKELKNYNNKIKDLDFINSQKLNDLELMVNSLGNQLRSNREIGMRVRKKVETTILPIRDSILKLEKILNTELKSFLSKKQYKKWIKYQKKEKKKLLPERPKSARQQQPTNRNRRGGMGRRGSRF